MISGEIVSILYNAASMQRWNDYPRLFELNELDKQSHKFVIAYFIAAYEQNINYHNLIEAGIFEFFRRVIVTDIRPDLFREVINEKESEINSWVLERIKSSFGSIQDSEFIERMSSYLTDEKFYFKERNLLTAAHYMATRWEFGIVYQSGKFLTDIEDLKKAVESDIEKFMHYRGVVEIGLGTKLTQIIDLCGRLRFQIRWAQTPRIPKTSVLGHQLIVAIFSYLYSKKINACDNRTIYNFYCALFHDLPEAFTRDIVTPVKKSVKGLDDLILNYEIKLIRNKILPLVPEHIKDQFSFILGLVNDKKNEFQNRVMIDNKILEDIDLSNYNSNKYCAIDGRALKACDHLAAFTEAILSINYGIKSKELENGIKLKHNYLEKLINGIDFGKVMLNIEEYYK